MQLTAKTRSALFSFKNHALAASLVLNIVLISFSVYEVFMEGASVHDTRSPDNRMLDLYLHYANGFDVTTDMLGVLHNAYCAGLDEKACTDRLDSDVQALDVKTQQRYAALKQKGAFQVRDHSY